MNGLARLRIDKGYSQSDICDFLGMYQCTYSNKETGKTDLTLTEAKEVSEILGVTLDRFYELLIEWH